MNKVIRKHYPASKLPKDLRGNIPSSAYVEVVVEEEPAERPSMETLRSLVADLPRSAVSEADAVARIRELRNEWDE